MTSGSVIYKFPLAPVPTFSIAKFLINSHPMAPAPTIKQFISIIFCNVSLPKITKRPSKRLFNLLKFMVFKDCFIVS